MDLKGEGKGGALLGVKVENDGDEEKSAGVVDAALCQRYRGGSGGLERASSQDGRRAVDLGRGCWHVSFEGEHSCECSD